MIFLNSKEIFYNIFTTIKEGFVNNVYYVFLNSAAPSSDRRLFICLFLDGPTSHRPWQNGPWLGREDLGSWMNWEWEVGCEELVVGSLMWGAVWGEGGEMEVWSWKWGA